MTEDDAMMKSMTGFGRATVEAEGMLWTVEVTSVNSRFLEVQARLPRLLSGIEFAARKAIGERLARGRVTLTITWEALPDAAESLVINASLARSYVSQLRELKETHQLDGDVTVGTLASLPDLFTTALEGGDRERRDKMLLEALGRALDALGQMRIAEAEKLGVDVGQRISLIRNELDAINGEAEEYTKALVEKLQARMQQLFADVALDPQRLAQEASFLAERSDVTEERIRLAAHLDEFEATLKKGGEVGRRFNFLLQEMLRETNTIGSKTGELTVIRRVIKIKEELEKIREQAQNLE